jgi:molecular chaperone DnaK
MNDLVVGIDLGTTFSSVAYVDEQGTPRVIPNAEGKDSTPSVVLVENGRIAVGEVALNQWMTNQEHVVRWIKRAMGDPHYRFQGLSAVEISAEILKALKADAELFLGQPVTEAVITCPAYFASIEIESTQQAGERAGFHVREIVKEPTAAAVHYGVEQMREGEKVLVCDLGGGTFDATVLAFEKGCFVPLASMGDRRLGGHDWTSDLVELVAERLVEAGGDDPRDDLVAGQMLYEACERAKRDLARVEEVAIPCSVGGRVEQVKVRREELESCTEWRIGALVSWSERALDKAGLDWAGIDQILLVGGSSRLRRMALALAEASRKTPVHGREPDLMVALGAAILARGQVRARRAAGGLREASRGGLTDVVYKRTLARSLGTRVVALDGGAPRIRCALIIPHGTETPVSRSREDFEVAADGQQVFDVPVVEFESDDELDVVGNFRFTCPPGARRGDRITVWFHYDASGIVRAEAVDRTSGRPLAVERLDYQEPNLEEILRGQAAPRWVVFAVDASGSMQGTKMEAARRGVVDNARELLAAGGEHKVGVVSFATFAEIVCRPTSDLAEVERAVDCMIASGTTAMHAGIGEAVELAREAPPGTDRDVVLVTDGLPDNQPAALAAAAKARSLGVSLCSLGIGHQDVDEAFLRDMTPLTLVIDKADGLGRGMTTLLRQAEARRGGLREPLASGLREVTP